MKRNVWSWGEKKYERGGHRREEKKGRRREMTVGGRGWVFFAPRPN